MKHLHIEVRALNGNCLKPEKREQKSGPLRLRCKQVLPHLVRARGGGGARSFVWLMREAVQRIVHDQLTTCKGVILEKLTVTQLAMKFTAFMEPRGSLSFSQKAASGPYPQQEESRPHLPTHSLKIIAIFRRLSRSTKFIQFRGPL